VPEVQNPRGVLGRAEGALTQPPRSVDHSESGAAG
jgi:hypothetical protein